MTLSPAEAECQLWNTRHDARKQLHKPEAMILANRIRVSYIEHIDAEGLKSFQG